VGSLNPPVYHFRGEFSLHFQNEEGEEDALVVLAVAGDEVVLCVAVVLEGLEIDDHS
jgi:hypothetical protein